MSDQVRAAIAAFIVENFLFGESERLPREDDSLLEAGIIDSTGVLELIEFLEQEFAIQVSDVETVPENLGSITNLTSYVVGKRQAA